MCSRHLTAVASWIALTLQRHGLESCPESATVCNASILHELHLCLDGLSALPVRLQASLCRQARPARVLWAPWPRCVNVLCARARACGLLSVVVHLQPLHKRKRGMSSLLLAPMGKPLLTDHVSTASLPAQLMAPVHLPIFFCSSRSPSKWATIPRLARGSLEAAGGRGFTLPPLELHHTTEKNQPLLSMSYARVLVIISEVWAGCEGLHAAWAPFHFSCRGSPRCCAPVLVL